MEGFSWALADYSMPQIIAAMQHYVKTASDIPAPADIIKIITEMNKPKPHEFTIDDLRRFREKGIPLSQAQKAMLDAEEVINNH